MHVREVWVTSPLHVNFLCKSIKNIQTKKQPDTLESSFRILCIHFLQKGDVILYLNKK